MTREPVRKGSPPSERWAVNMKCRGSGMHMLLAWAANNTPSFDFHIKLIKEEKVPRVLHKTGSLSFQSHWLDFRDVKIIIILIPSRIAVSPSY